jgi:peptidoglycan/xylan/chitin deacetylase (PgdA/CDA1 family)
MPVLFRSRKKIKWQVDSCTSALQKALNDSLFRPLYFRPSMGWYNRRTMKIIRERNMRVNGITMYTVDTKKTADNTDKIIKEIVKKAEKHNGGIVVLHDGIASYTWLERRLKQGWKTYDRSFIPVVTDSIITILKRKGFAFPELDGNSPHDLSEEQRIFFKDIVYF